MSKLRRDVKSLTLHNKKVRDYDPEDDHAEQGEESGSDQSEQEDVNAGREHYEKVGKSRLRQPEGRSLGSKYAGVAVSRTALTGDDDDSDMFAEANMSADEDSDPFAEGDGDSGGIGSEYETHEEDRSESNARIRRSSQTEDVDGESGHEEASDEDMSALSQEEDSDDEEGDDSGQDSQDGQEDESSRQISSKRADLKAHLSQASSLANGLAQAASSDVKKGQAVKAQYQTFDRLLDARMKLQRGVVASETIRVQSTGSSFVSDAESAIVEAQKAALQLFDTISSFREDIYKISLPDRKSRKRKMRSNDDVPDLTSLWDEVTAQEVDAQPYRVKVIDKWSNKVRAADPNRMAASSKSKFLDPSQNDRISAILQTYIINEQDKHFQAQNIKNSESVGEATAYDDDMFYQSLLRDLIATRAATSNAAQNLSLSALPPKLHPSGNRQNRQVRDTKASKGRKVRYNVHEKLQNFMAAEGDTGRDTAMWTDRGKNEFFGSLFGQDRALNEEEDENMVDGEDGNAEVEALRLFSA